MKQLTSAILILSLLVLAGCKQTPETSSRASSGEAGQPNGTSTKLNSALKDPGGNGLILFKALLEKYGRTKTFQSICSISYVTDGQESTPILSERAIFYSAPNMHRVTTISGDLISTSVSDGTNIGEFNSTAAELLRSSPTMAEQTATMISNYNFCGSLLYDFFAGPDRIQSILDASGTEIRRQITDIDGIVLLSFKARAPYGTTEMKVDERTSNILEIKSLMEPVISQNDGVEEKFKLKSILLTEKYSKIQFDKPIKSEAFKFDPPSNLEVRDRRSEQAALSLQKGIPAPEFTLKDANGTAVSLKSLRGQVVLLDFWAAWCQPCRDFAPYSTELNRRFKSKGLAVVPICNEEPQLIKIAFEELGLVGLNPIFDRDKKVSELYKVVQYPTYVVIDRQGRVSSVLVGKQDSKQVQIQLKVAGMNLD